MKLGNYSKVQNVIKSQFNENPIEEDVICTVCWETLSNFYDYYKLVIRNQTYLTAEPVFNSPDADELTKITQNTHPTVEQSQDLPIFSNVEVVDLPIIQSAITVQHEIDSQNIRTRAKRTKPTTSTSCKSTERPSDPQKDDQMPGHLKCRSRKAQADAQIRDFVNLVCDLCANQSPFLSFKKLQEHFEEAHQTKGYIICCERKIYRKDRILNHITNHVNPDAFKYVKG